MTDNATEDPLRMPGDIEAATLSFSFSADGVDIEEEARALGDGEARDGGVLRGNATSSEEELVRAIVILSGLEKAASRVGIVAFTCATVVLLGGFISSLKIRDISIISLLSLIERTQAFSRNKEMQWQRAAPLARKPHMLYYLQVGLVSLSIVLPIVCLSTLSGVSSKNKNQDYAIKVFYVLNLAKALILLVVRACWEYQADYRVERVILECQLGTDQIDNVNQFCTEVYFECLSKGSAHVLAGDRDLVAYVLAQIQGNSTRGQLQILLAFLRREASSDHADQRTRARIERTPGVIKRLLEMLAWEEIREVAAQIVCQLVRQNSSISYTIVDMPGALQSIVSLLSQQGDHQLRVLGLQILKIISATDQQNCIKIGKGLVQKLVTLVEIKDASELENKQRSELKVLKKALQVIKCMVVTTTGTQGKGLREKIISHLRNVLVHAQNHPAIRGLALDILTNLSQEDCARTGEIIQHILQIFLQETTENQLWLRVKAGEALNILSFRSPRNFRRMCRGDEEILDHIIAQLDNVELVTSAVKVLRNYLTGASQEEVLKVAASTPRLLELIPGAEGEKLEAALGLAAAIVPHSDLSCLDKRLSRALAEKIALIMGRGRQSHKLLRLWRYAGKVLKVLTSSNGPFLQEIQEVAVAMRLSRISDMEDFCTVLGELGLTKHLMDITNSNPHFT